MELRHLRYFLVVAEERSFSRAAARLHMAQPPLSQQIGRLEKDLGFTVFERVPRGVRLTPAGEALVQGARATLAAADDARRSAAAAHTGATGRLSLAFMNSAAYDILPRLLRAFTRAHSGVVVEAREMAIADQIDALLQGRIDVGILRPPIADARLAGIPLADEPFVVALPARHPLASKRILQIGDLANELLVGYPRGHVAGFRERIDAAFHTAGVDPRVAQEATHIHTQCALVAGGVGVAIVPDSARRLAMQDVAFVRLAHVDLRARTWLAWSAHSTSSQIRQFVDAAQTVFDAAGTAATPRTARR